MKTFKFIQLFFLSVTCIIICACSNDNDSLPKEDDEFVLVPLSMSYDISEKDLPLSKASTKTPYYVFDVREFNVNTSKFESYSEGIFDNIDGLQLKLKKDKKYDINVILLYDYLEQYRFGSGNLQLFVTNKFNYRDPIPPHEVCGAYLEPFCRKKDNESLRCAIVDAYYGYKTEYIPSKTCNIEMKRIVTGLEFEIKGVKEGKVVVNYPLNMELDMQNNMNFIFTDSQLRDHNAIYEEFSFPLSFKFVDKNGKETPIYNQETTFKRGYKKRFVLNIKEAALELDSNVSFTLEELTLQDELPIELDVQL